MPRVETPQFKFPFEVADGQVNVVEQDDEDEIMDCVEVLLLTDMGERQEVPDYGIPDQTFRQNGVDMEAVLEKVALWEPRAQVTIEQNDLTEFVQTLTVNVRGRSGA